MAILIKKNRFFRRYLAISAMLATLAPGYLLAAPASPDIAGIKKALLDDPLFLSHLRDRLSVESLESDAVRTVIRNYLLENPQIIFEMQEALNTKTAAQSAQDEQNQAEIIKNASRALFHSPDDVVLGNPKGDVTIVEFYDYNCGYCKRSFPGLQKLVKNDHGIRFIMKDYPILGQDSVQAHLVAQAMRKLMPGKYPLFHEKMITYNGRATEQSALDIARSLGADEKKLRAAMQDKALQAPLIENAEIAYKLGINYTPAYIVGSRILPGAVGDKALVAIIQEERKKGK